MNDAAFLGEKTFENFGPLTGQCCSQPGDLIKGTYFFGGAGLKGHYISSMILSLRKVGITHSMFIDKEKWSAGITRDIALGYLLWREYDPDFQMLLRIPNMYSTQFNLIGYSYGSVIAAQLAAKYAKKGTIIDHLVLIASPVSKSFLNTLYKLTAIKIIILKDLKEYGDPIYAGMNTLVLCSKLPLLAIQLSLSEGHFHYAKPGKDGDRRRLQLAKQLYSFGLR